MSEGERMARTYTITVTDDETGAVIFAGRPTAALLMVLAPDTPGRLRCASCKATVADDLAGMGAEGDGADAAEDDGDPASDPKCHYCGLWIWRSDGGGWVAHGTTTPFACPESAWGHYPR